MLDSVAWWVGGVTRTSLANLCVAVVEKLDELEPRH